MRLVVFRLPAFAAQAVNSHAGNVDVVASCHCCSSDWQRDDSHPVIPAQKFPDIAPFIDDEKKRTNHKGCGHFVLIYGHCSSLL
jgi:hypothetical protein